MIGSTAQSVIRRYSNTTLAAVAGKTARLRGRRLSWRESMHAVRFNKALSLEADFRAEVCEFFGVTPAALVEMEAAYGGFGSQRFHQYVESFFEGKTVDDGQLFTAYAKSALPYSLLLGAGCPRYATLYPFLDYVCNRLDGQTASPLALDYGPGVGDTALLLSTLGFQMCLVDLVDAKSEFALWRLRRRGYRPHFIPATAETPYPALPSGVNLVVTIEVWEHLRHPVKALDNINLATAPGKSLMVNTNVDFGHRAVGDHLRDGMDEGQSQLYRDRYAQAWRHVPVEAPDGRLYERI